eukprot:PLAT6153.1.p1 GENE.PLAT6153.1~~PLAT6153.1.p1  ORF type:complete len:242 (+),score=56.73 PLAT6153.1:125-850(+)
MDKIIMALGPQMVTGVFLFAGTLFFPHWVSNNWQIVVIALILLQMCLRGKASPNGDPLAGIGEKADSLDSLTVVKGDKFNVGGGHVSVVEFWVRSVPLSTVQAVRCSYLIHAQATWCPPCAKSIPHLSKLADEWKSKGVRFVGVTSESEGTVKAFVEKRSADVRYTIALDGTSAVGRGYSAKWSMHGIPHAFVVDGDGVITWKGHPMDPKMVDAIQRAVAGEKPVVAGGEGDDGDGHAKGE